MMSDTNETIEQSSSPTAAGRMFRMVLLPGLLVGVLIIVAIIVMPDGDVHSLIDTLAEEGRDRWRAADALARVLHGSGNEDIKRDPAVARRIAAILQKELDAGRMDIEHIRLRAFLCLAMGELHTDIPLPTLLRTARTERDEKEVIVRRSAIAAIAVLASKQEAADLQANEELLSTLEQATEHRDASVREVAAFALGVVGGDRACGRLASLLESAPPGVRHNAATGLARHGDPRCVETLIDMLDPKRLQSGKETNGAAIVINALRATDQLAAANPNDRLDALTLPVERLTKKAVPSAIRVKAIEVLETLNSRHP